LRESLSIFQRLVEAHPDNNDNREGLSDSYAGFGAEFRHRAVQPNSSKWKRLEDWRDARINYEKSLDVWCTSEITVRSKQRKDKR
jgi:hypothetical protein